MIREQFIYDATEDRIVHKRTFDVNTTLDQVKRIKDAGMESPVAISDSYLAARIPMWLINEWLKEAGVKWDDPAAKDVVLRNIQSGNHKKLRVWEGRI